MYWACIWFYERYVWNRRGSVRIPLLNLVGLSLLSAFGISLFVIPFSSFAGALRHRKNITKRIGIDY